MTLPTRTLGTSGIAVSVIGLGANNFGRQGTATAEESGTRRVVDAAIDHGVTFIDTADIYGAPPTTSETLLGRVLGSKRHEIVLATKFGHADFPVPGTEQWGPKGARRYIRNAVDASLTRLRTDWIDLYQMHTPDALTPVQETTDALEELVEAGKIRAYGHSNFSPEEIRAAADANGAHSWVSAQDEYSLLQRRVEAEVLPLVRGSGLSFLPYFPLANGLLTGKYTEHERPRGARITELKPQLFEGVRWSVLREYERIAREAGFTMLEATFSWLLAEPAVASVIAGATSPEQIAQNAASARAMDADVRDAISDLFS